jgi:hypothetical protein
MVVTWASGVLPPIHVVPRENSAGATDGIHMAVPSDSSVTQRGILPAPAGQQSNRHNPTLSPMRAVCCDRESFVFLK